MTFYYGLPYQPAKRVFFLSIGGIFFMASYYIDDTYRTLMLVVLGSIIVGWAIFSKKYIIQLKENEILINKETIPYKRISNILIEKDLINKVPLRLHFEYMHSFNDQSPFFKEALFKHPKDFDNFRQQLVSKTKLKLDEQSQKSTSSLFFERYHK